MSQEVGEIERLAGEILNDDAKIFQLNTERSEKLELLQISIRKLFDGKMVPLANEYGYKFLVEEEGRSISWEELSNDGKYKILEEKLRYFPFHRYFSPEKKESALREIYTGTGRISFDIHLTFFYLIKGEDKRLWGKLYFGDYPPKLKTIIHPQYHSKFGDYTTIPYSLVPEYAEQIDKRISSEIEDEKIKKLTRSLTSLAFEIPIEKIEESFRILIPKYENDILLRALENANQK